MRAQRRARRSDPARSRPRPHPFPRRRLAPGGNVTASTGSSTVPFRYAGEYADPDSGLIYLRARFYDPNTGQFLTRDALEDITHEPYVYAGGDPVNQIDPLGLDAMDVINDVADVIDDVVPDRASNFAAGYLDGWTEGQISKAFGIDQWCDAPGYGTGNATSNVSVKGGVKIGIRSFAKQRGRYGGRKPDIKQVNSAAREGGIPKSQRREFGEFVEAEKQGGPDFSYQELRELAEEFKRQKGL